MLPKMKIPDTISILFMNASVFVMNVFSIVDKFTALILSILAIVLTIIKIFNEMQRWPVVRNYFEKHFPGLLVGKKE
jgi:hypothetical protein